MPVNYNVPMATYIILRDHESVIKEFKVRMRCIHNILIHCSQSPTLEK